MTKTAETLLGWAIDKAVPLLITGLIAGVSWVGNSVLEQRARASLFDARMTAFERRLDSELRAEVAATRARSDENDVRHEARLNAVETAQRASDLLGAELKTEIRNLSAGINRVEVLIRETRR
ncbi:hypothetical protein EOD42_14210 [Rhodovarius crocodyli]|uniref:Uncharacterized protein n=1 Tax=Rhodovarius crocodyli TaxID=1979269 RepID=A0A437MF61_9PROT|nr:hypothetical protein [Rhodovarius crocodyli]RVT96262.1 hypothetical protein EOD42_14210 [Rhodovarius crocodyli]